MLLEAIGLLKMLECSIEILYITIEPVLKACINNRLATKIFKTARSAAKFVFFSIGIFGNFACKSVIATGFQ